MPSTRTLKGALVGCGFVSRFHLEAWRRVEGAKIVAVCDPDPDRLERGAAGAPGARPYLDVASMLDNGPFDFVEICTGPEQHRKLVAVAAKHGAHVLCQKPAAPDRADLLAMIGDCEAAGVRLMIHENWRFRPWNRALRFAIDAGAVGRPVRLRIAHRDTRALRPGGFSDQPFLASRPRLILMEMGCHLIDTARYLFGEVGTVYATLGRFGEGHPGEDVATLSLVFDGGALGLLDMSWCASAETSRPDWALNDTVVEGTEGALKVQHDGSLLFTGLDGTTDRRPVAMPADDRVYVDGYAATQTHFIEGLRTGAEHETSGTETLKTMDVVWAAYRSAEEGRALSVSG